MEQRLTQQSSPNKGSNPYSRNWQTALSIYMYISITNNTHDTHTHTPSLNLIYVSPLHDSRERPQYDVYTEQQ